MKNNPKTLQKRNTLRRHFFKVTPKESVPRYIDRICKSCNQIKSCRFTSSFTQTGKPEYRAKCDECHTKYEKALRRKNRPKLNRQAMVRKRVFKLKCISYLGGMCKKCGYNKNPRALTFHHLDRVEKEFSISQVKDWSWARVQKELDKCELICFNCHMEAEDAIYFPVAAELKPDPSEWEYCF